MWMVKWILMPPWKKSEKLTCQLPMDMPSVSKLVSSHALFWIMFLQEDA